MAFERYNPKVIEPKWQAYWDENNTYCTNLQSDKPKYIGMSMFNYPSGAGIHIGHAMNYTISDVMARFKRQQGYESYHPVGWDAFGLPAENYAIKAGVSPQDSMAKIIPDYHRQYKAMGWSNDWSKEISTHLPIYYKWTQWIFSEMYRAGLAYQDVRMQWFCEKCQTVLANEQIEANGKCWRHDSPEDVEVTKREVKQWFFKITDYADELLEATESLDWTESVKLAQKNWIGKSKGAEIIFQVQSEKQKGVSKELDIAVFTTRPDTIFGATFLVLAPEHELVSGLTVEGEKSRVENYIKEVSKKTEIERQASKEKTGVFTGSYAINPATNEQIPIWVADYVLVGYGTGAIMAVPAHDERDNEFARAFNLPIIEVVAPDFGTPLPDAVDVTGPVVVGYDPKIKQYMSLINTKNSMRWFVAGGLNEGEDYEQAALRELGEEAGFTKVEKLIQLGGPNYSYYYNSNKNSNRRSFSYTYLAILNKEDQDTQRLESHESYEVVWSDLDLITNDFEKESEGREHWIDGMARTKSAVEAFELGKEYMPPIFTEEGVLFNSGVYSGIPTAEAREKIVADLTAKGSAIEKTTYKLRDWSVSRQRYWGAPIPIVNCGDCGPVLLDDSQLPVILPELDDFQPSGDGRSALARAAEWLKVDCPTCGKPAERETDTLDTYICSSWYMLRYLDPANENEAFGSEIANNWMPIDFYNGGDHATAHMMYARFVTRFFHKKGLLNNPEPFKKFLFNGKVTASDGQNFSKSKGNGVDPLEIIASGYGADALRTYLMFAAPLDTWMRWDPQGVPGTYRFLSRVYNIVHEFLEESPVEADTTAPLKAVHAAIKKTTSDLEDQKYNTAISAMMKATNDLYEIKAKEGFAGAKQWREALEALVMLVAPFAPHTAEDLWHSLGHEDSVNKDHWPVCNEAYLVDDSVTIAVQVNGKVRGEVSVPIGTTEPEILAAALELARVRDSIGEKPIKKTIYINGKILSIVI